MKNEKMLKADCLSFLNFCSVRSDRKMPDGYKNKILNRITK